MMKHLIKTKISTDSHKKNIHEIKKHSGLSLKTNSYNIFFSEVTYDITPVSTNTAYQVMYGGMDLIFLP